MSITKTEMLQRILEHYRLFKNTDAAEFFGVSPQTMFARKNSGKIDFEEIYRKCPDISPDWLLSGGEGEMLRNDGGSQKRKQEVAGDSDDRLEKALEALEAEQQAVRRAQDQISALIELLRSR